MARGCVHRFNTCKVCNRKGHLEIVCQKSRNKQRSIQHLKAKNETEDFSDSSNCEDQEEESDFYHVDAGVVKTTMIGNIASAPMYVNVDIASLVIKMEVDCGSYWSVISEETKNCYFSNLKLSGCNTILRAYGGVQLFPLGILKNVNVKFNKISKNLDLIVMRGTGPALFGRSWLFEFGLWPLFKNNELNNLRNEKNNILYKSLLADNLKSKYTQLFTPGQGLFNKGTLKLKLKENAIPVACKVRHLPFGLRDEVEKELDRLLALGHIEPVSNSN